MGMKSHIFGTRQTFCSFYYADSHSAERSAEVLRDEHDHGLFPQIQRLPVLQNRRWRYIFHRDLRPTNVYTSTIFNAIESLVGLVILQSRFNDNVGHILKIFENNLMSNTHAILFWNSPTIPSYVFLTRLLLFKPGRPKAGSIFTLGGTNLGCGSMHYWCPANTAIEFFDWVQYYFDSSPKLKRCVQVRVVNNVFMDSLNEVVCNWEQTIQYMCMSKD
jgi:hypothetical protein